MGPFVDRRIAKAIAIKRIVTGTMGFLLGAALLVGVVSHGSAPVALVACAVLFFFGGGAWSLRDGLRLLRELRAS
jgi:hypothetical protein